MPLRSLTRRPVEVQIQERNILAHSENNSTLKIQLARDQVRARGQKYGKENKETQKT